MMPMLRGRGVSLRNAYIARSQKEATDLIADHSCAACGRTDRYISGDKGKQHQLDDIHYYKVGMKCICGFTNFAYLVINDILKSANSSMPSSVEAIQKAVQSNALSDPVLEELLLDTKVQAFHGKLKEAIDTSRECLNRFPDSAAALYNLGYLLLKTQNYQDSLFYLNQSVKIDPKFSASWYQMGIIHQELGNYQEAILHYNTFLLSYPDHSDAAVRRQTCTLKLSS